MTGLDSVYVESWAAIIADPLTGEPQRLGACADAAAIPTALRRRLGTFARMAVTCSMNLAGSGDADLVLASQYGDLALTDRLLADVVSGGLLSPAAFSMSVHNAPAGLLDIIRASTVGHTAIAAGTESLSAGLLEGWLRLQQRPDMPVVVVFADEAPPEGPLPAPDTKRQGVALALRLAAIGTTAAIAQLALSPLTRPATMVPSLELARRLIDFFAQRRENATVRWPAQGFDWHVRGTW